MAINQVPNGRPASVAESQRARVASDGLRSHRHAAFLLEAQGPRSARDLADAVHLLCAVHGRYPGLIALAAQHSAEGSARAWLQEAAAAFEVERNYLLQLTASVGPIPSTPGAAQTEASLVAARHAIETLAVSERAGCALGAASALLGDWRSVRPILDRAASRAGLDWRALELPSEHQIESVLNAVAESPAAARALAFGAEQMLLQHRALFALLEARAGARGDF